MSTPADRDPWRNPMVWLVVGLPLAAVVAGFITLWIAATHVDPLVGPAATSSASAPP
jgi:hypothetical protein